MHSSIFSDANVFFFSASSSLSTFSLSFLISGSSRDELKTSSIGHSELSNWPIGFLVKYAFLRIIMTLRWTLPVPPGLPSELKLVLDGELTMVISAPFIGLKGVPVYCEEEPSSLMDGSDKK